MKDVLRLRLGDGPRRAHLLMVLKGCLLWLEAQIEKDRTFFPVTMVVRVLYLGFVINRYYSRINGLGFTAADRTAWWDTVWCFITYVVALAALRVFMLRAYNSMASKWVQIASDTMFFSIFFLVNRDPESNLILAFLLPLYIALRHLTFFETVAVIISVLGALALVFSAGFSALPPIPGAPHSLPHVYVVRVLLFICFVVLVIRSEMLGGQHLLRQRERVRETEYRLRQGARLAVGYPPDEVLGEATKAATAELRLAETVAVFRYEDGVFRRLQATGLPDGFLPEERYRPGEGVTGKAGLKGSSGYGEAIRDNKVHRNALYRAEYQKVLPSGAVAHLLAVPLQGANHIFGILRAVNKLDEVGRIDPQGFTEEDQRLLVEIAAGYALAYTLSVLHEKTAAGHLVHEAVLAGADDRGICGAAVDAIARMRYPMGRILLTNGEGPLTVFAATSPTRDGWTEERLQASLKGYHWQAMHQRQPVVVAELHRSRHQRASKGEKAREIHSALVLPLLDASGPLGVMEVFRGADSAFTDEEWRGLASFAAQTATAIFNARLIVRDRAQVRELNAIEEVTGAALEAGTLEEVLDIVTSSICKTLGFHLAAVSLVDESNSVIRTVKASGLAEEWQGLAEHPLSSDDIQAHIVRTAQKERITGPDPRLDGEIFERFEHQYLDRLFVPLCVRGSVIGTIEVGYDTRRQCQGITSGNAQLLDRFVQQISLVIQNAYLREQERSRLQLAQRRLEVMSTEVDAMYHSHGGRKLAAAQLHLENLLDSRPKSPEEQLACLRTVQLTVRGLRQQLVRTLLIGQLGDGTARLNRKTVDVADLIDGVVDVLAVEADKKGIDLEVYSEGVGRFNLDDEKIDIAVGDIVSNAIKYTPPGGKVTVRAERHTESLRLIVTDTGIGIAPEHQRHVFEKHYQVEARLPKERAGYGIGLYLARSFTDLHSGNIDLQSTVGCGCVFTITLPCQE